MLGHDDLLLTGQWPVADRALMQEDTVVIAVQVNGKLRGQVEVAAPPVEEKVFEAVAANEKISGWIAGKEIVKRIYVPGKLVNLVIK
jgi:leucyl-tRNA synthetase